MASFNKFNSFVEAICEEVHDFENDTLKIALTDTEPSATDTQFLPGSSHPPPTNTNGYSAGGQALDNVVSSQTSGTFKLEADDEVFTASGGDLGPFRYALLYNDSATNDEVIGWWDYGSSITLSDGESFTVDIDATNGVLQIS